MSEKENTPPTEDTTQPGQVIAPSPSAPPPSPEAIASPAAPPAQPPAPQPLNPIESVPQDDPSPYQENVSSAATSDTAVHWTASEFIAHEKSASWYIMLSVATLVLAAIVYILTRDKISAAVILIGAFFLGFYAGRQPQQLDYQVDARGVQIGQKFHAFSDFRSFAVIPEGTFSSIVFMPLKRFAPMLTIYYAPDDEPKILGLVSQNLPLEERGLDAVDSLMRRIRF